MASLFTHVVAAGALGQAAAPERRSDRRFWYMAALVSVLPDADVIGFKLGVRYGDLWGHRGMTHSLLFAAILGLAAAARFKPAWKGEGRRLALVFTLITASHGLLDALTNGGLGMTFFAPFNRSRYFLPWRPILVSPIGAANFFNEYGRRVILSEIRWVWLPALAIGALLRLLKRPRAG